MVIGEFWDFAGTQGGHWWRGCESGLEISWSPDVEKFMAVETDARAPIYRSRSGTFELERGSSLGPVLRNNTLFVLTRILVCYIVRLIHITRTRRVSQGGKP